MLFSGEISIEKNGRRENIFQNKCVSSQNKMCEDGATVAATPLPSAQLADATVVRRP
jgi:hypothetical protein